MGRVRGGYKFSKLKTGRVTKIGGAGSKIGRSGPLAQPVSSLRKLFGLLFVISHHTHNPFPHPNTNTLPHPLISRTFSILTSSTPHVCNSHSFFYPCVCNSLEPSPFSLILLPHPFSLLILPLCLQLCFPEHRHTTPTHQLNLHHCGARRAPSPPVRSSFISHLPTIGSG